MMASGGSSKIFVVVVLLFAALLAFLVATALSVVTIQGYANDATTAYEAYKQDVSDYDYRSALISIKDAGTSATKIDDELNSWQWKALAVLPYVGDEVTRAQRLSGIVNRLASEALIPVADDASRLLSSEDVDNIISMLSAKSDVLAQLYHSLESARNTVDECRTDLESIPSGWLEPLNQAVSQTLDVVVTADDTFDSIGFLFDAISDLDASTASNAM